MNAILTTAQLSPTDSHADYVAWLVKEVQDSIDDPNPSVPHAVVVAEWEAEAAEIRASMKQLVEA